MPADEKQAGGGAATAEEFFDASFLAELEELAAVGGVDGSGSAVSALLQARLATFLNPPPELGIERTLTAESFAELPPAALTERVNTLIDLCRESPRGGATQAVESFIVFFRALLPTLADDGAGEMKRLFFRLVPTLLHVAFNDFAESGARRRDGPEALRSLERVLLEIASVRLAPTESELVFRSIDQMAGFISVGEYHMASQVICSQLLSIIERNKLTRALYRLMQIEVAVQRYLKDRLGYPTPQIRLPGDAPALTEYGPLRILDERDGAEDRRFIQVHLPGIEMPADVVLHLVSRDTGVTHDLRLDALGSAALAVPDGDYDLGLVYEPDAP